MAAHTTIREVAKLTFDAEVGKLLLAVADYVEEAHDSTLAQDDQCDHSVGICWCAYRLVLERLMAKVEEFAPLRPREFIHPKDVASCEFCEESGVRVDTSAGEVCSYGTVVRRYRSEEVLFLMKVNGRLTCEGCAPKATKEYKDG